MIFHITTAELWAAAQKARKYDADSLATEGFIHCSTEEQVAQVANAAFRGREGLVVMHIDEGRLEVPVTYENLEGGEQLFPHVYGPVTVEAVIRVSPLEAETNGEFVFGAVAP